MLSRSRAADGHSLGEALVLGADFTWVSQGCLQYMVSIQGEGEPLFLL